MIKAIKRKLNSKKGETLVESLAGLVVIVFAIMIIAGAIVSAAKVNKMIKDKNTNFMGGGTVVPAIAAPEGDTIVIKHTGTGAADSFLYSGTASDIVVEYKTDNDYYYYKVRK